jgi:IS605 OrfB family transposase
LLLLTYRYRIKESTSKHKLKRLASSVNFVWNYVNNLSHQNVKKHNRWLSAFDINSFLNGAGNELDLSQRSLREVARNYVSNRRTFKKNKLKWRSAKRSLGWVPFEGCDVKVKDDSFVYRGKSYHFYRSRPLPDNSKIKTGSVTQDARDRWYVSFVIELPEAIKHINADSEVGIDLGIKEQIALSDGTLHARGSLTREHELKLAKFQRARKKRQTRNLHAKIRNKRLDWTHKATTEIARKYDRIYVGDLKAAQIIEKNRKVAKGILDASPTRIITFLEYKAKRLGGKVTRVPESWTTVTCSECFARSGPTGQTGLSVREWSCSGCGAEHHRDVNAGQNILRLGRQALFKGASSEETSLSWISSL